MNCPQCGNADTRVRRTLPASDVKIRVLSCPAGHAFETIETYRGLLPVASPHATGTPPPSVRHAPPTRFGGFGGSLPSGSVPTLPEPPGDSVKELIAPARKRKGRGDAKPYPPEFERLWQACTGRRGNKEPAFKAVLKFNPDIDLTIAKYHEMVASLEPWRTAKNFSSWLNAKGWQDDYQRYVPPASPARARVQEDTARDIRATDRQIARLREAQAHQATPEQLAELRAQRNGAAK